MTVSVRNLDVRYGAKSVLRDINLQVEKGEWLSLIGPNGSGKTTLLRCIAGQIAPHSGSVHIGGHSVQNAPEKAMRLLGYAHPPERLPDLLTGRQCLQVYAEAFNSPTANPALAENLQMTAALDQPVRTYSLGMRQKLSFLLALTADPSLIVLDEAFNGLDPAATRVLKTELRTRVRENRSAVVLATHDLLTVRNDATHAALLIDGTLAKSWTRADLEDALATFT